jgi:hypothetical protein
MVGRIILDQHTNIWFLSVYKIWDDFQVPETFPVRFSTIVPVLVEMNKTVWKCIKNKHKAIHILFFIDERFNLLMSEEIL